MINEKKSKINKEGALINKTKDHTINEPEEKKRDELARSFNLINILKLI